MTDSVVQPRRPAARRVPAPHGRCVLAVGARAAARPGRLRRPPPGGPRRRRARDTPSRRFPLSIRPTVRCCRDLPPVDERVTWWVCPGTGDAFEQQSAGLVLPHCRYATISRTRCDSRGAHVLDTLLQVGGAQLRPWTPWRGCGEHALYRKLNEFDAAEQSYAEGVPWPQRSGTPTPSCFSRIGRADNATGRGIWSRPKARFGRAPPS